MNERIKELAEQAGLEFGSYDRYGLFDEEKFAELIVRECCNVVRDEVQFISDFDKADVVVNEVKKHFGVE
jgi:hypothetical protein